MAKYALCDHLNFSRDQLWLTLHLQGLPAPLHLILKHTSDNIAFCKVRTLNFKKIQLQHYYHT